MKKIIMETQIDDKAERDPIVEDYLVEDDVDADKYARELIDSFNNTLRPRESSRTLLSVKVEKSAPIMTAKEFLDELDSPIENLRWDVEDYEIEEGIVEYKGTAEDDILIDPFENVHPMGIVKGGISIGVYADPMSFSSTQADDFIALELNIADGMGERKYYTTRIEDPGDAVDGFFDLVVIDYGGMTIPGMSGMGGHLVKSVRTILDEKPSTMVWLASVFTVNGYMDLVEDEYGEEHPNLIISELHKEESWKPLHDLWEM